MDERITDEKIDVVDEVAVVHPLKVADDLVPIRRVVVITLLMILAGVATGFLLSLAKNVPIVNKTLQSPQEVKKTVGLKDKKTFKDKAEGILKEGGIEGEGQFHLERAGGESQNVYLTSTTVDLSEFIDKKVRVWGETFAAEKAGWLMDVGLVEVL